MSHRPVAVFSQEETGQKPDWPAEVAELLLAALGAKVTVEPVDALAAVRSMFTHPDIADRVRESMLAEQRQAAEATPVEDADLRMGLIGALTLGTVIGRYLLGLDALRDAPPERITALLRASFHSIVHGDPEPDPAAGDRDSFLEGTRTISGGADV